MVELGSNFLHTDTWKFRNLCAENVTRDCVLMTNVQKLIYKDMLNMGNVSNTELKVSNCVLRYLFYVERRLLDILQRKFNTKFQKGISSFACFGDNTHQ